MTDSPQKPTLTSNSNPLRELPPEFDASTREAMRTKARRTKHECMAEMSDEWLANELRMLSRHDLWHEPFCVAARDRIMRLSMQLAEARGVIDALKSRSAETGDARDAARYRYIRNCLHCPETDLLITSRSKAPAECGVYSTSILDAIVDDAIKATSQKASEQRTAAEEWENAKAVMSGEMPPCECTLRDKAPSAYHNAKCPRYVADKL